MSIISVGNLIAYTSVMLLLQQIDVTYFSAL